MYDFASTLKKLFKNAYPSEAILLPYYFNDSWQDSTLRLTVNSCWRNTCRLFHCSEGSCRYWVPCGSKFLWDNIFLDFSSALCITKILALKVLVLYRCSPARYMNILRQCRRAPHFTYGQRWGSLIFKSN